MYLIKPVRIKQTTICQIILIMISLVVTTVNASDLQVPAQFSSIQSAINAAAVGDRVVVSKGTYRENIQLKNGVFIQGCGIDDCIIQGSNSNATVFASGVNATIDGFTINGGGGYRSPASENRIMGGGIYAESSTINIGHSKITLNNAEFGGAIALLNSEFKIIANTISDNNANKLNAKTINMGGGIYLYNSHGEISSNQILRNKVDNGHRDPTTVSGNSHQAPGGGVNIVFDRNVGDVKILSNIISDNVAAGSQHYGGGVYMYQANAALKNQVYVINNSISSNQALDGGGVAIVQMSPVIAGNTFSNNTAHWGGGIYGWNGAGLILQNSFDSNKAISIRAGAFTGGGGVLCDEDFTPTIAQNTFNKNTAVDYGGGLEVFDSDAGSIVWNNLFSFNSARIGGAMVASTSTPTIKRNYFDSNTASESGGAIFAEKTSNLGIKNNIFTGNSAASWGGGISLFDLSSSVVENNTFDSNSVGTFWGGGLHTYAGSLTLRNNQFTNNNKFAAGIDGGTSVTREYNNFFNNDVDCFQCPDSSTALNADPDYKTGDSFKLSASSPHLHQGNPSPEFNNRDGSANEAGAYGGPEGGFIITPGNTFSSPAANTNQAVYDAVTQKVVLPAVELGLEGGSLNVDVQLASCSSSTATLVKVLYPSIEYISNMDANQGTIYLAGNLFIPTLKVGNSQFSAFLSLFNCASDAAGLYLKLDALALKNN